MVSPFSLFYWDSSVPRGTYPLNHWMQPMSAMFSVAGSYFGGPPGAQWVLRSPSFQIQNSSTVSEPSEVLVLTFLSV
jgi:hypothetical protein